MNDWINFIDVFELAQISIQLDPWLRLGFLSALGFSLGLVLCFLLLFFFLGFDFLLFFLGEVRHFLDYGLRIQLLLVILDLLDEGVQLVPRVKVLVYQLIALPRTLEVLFVSLAAWGWINTSEVEVPVPLELVESLKHILSMFGAYFLELLKEI